eukprot:GHVR01119228.1.p1 GENE.GHVR01119228.1~~GHVR01119228.1.p1  ORF type:complete len:367 (+),score=85.77 GHVR01119228.1:69-1169(+)
MHTTTLDRPTEYTTDIHTSDDINTHNINNNKDDIKNDDLNNNEITTQTDVSAAVATHAHSFQSYFGIFFAFLAALFTSISTLLAKLGTEYFDIFYISQMRGIVLLFICIIIIIYQNINKYGIKICIKHIRPFGKKKSLSLVIIRGIIEAIGHILMYVAVYLLPLGDATSLILTHPIFGSIIAVIWLKEQWGWPLLLAGCISFSGVILVTRPQFLFGDINNNNNNNTEENDKWAPVWVGVLVAIISAICAGTGSAIVRRVGEAAPFVVIVFSFATFVLILSTIGVLIRSPYDLEQLYEVPLLGWIYLFGQAIVSFFSNTFIVLAFKFEAVGPAGFVMNFTIVFAFLWQVYKYIYLYLYLNIQIYIYI